MPPLRQRMIEDMPVRNLSPHTQRASLETVARFARHFGQSPAVLGPEQIRACQVLAISETQSLYLVRALQRTSAGGSRAAHRGPR